MIRLTCLPHEETRAYRMGYMQWHSDAHERYYTRKERQQLCKSCGKWHWADDAAEHAIWVRV